MIEEIDTHKIKPDSNQPREKFDEDVLKELALTYAKHGMIHAIEVDESNVIILGERRWRAAKIAGLEQVKIVRKKGMSKDERLERQLIDDFQRKSLNNIERAWAYATAITNINLEARGMNERFTIPEVKGMEKSVLLTLITPIHDEKGQSKSGQNELSRRIGVPQPTIYYYISMLDTPVEIQEAVEHGELPGTYAAEIARVKDPEQQQVVASIVLERKKEDKMSTGKDIKKIATIVETGSSSLIDEISKPEPRISLESAEKIAEGLELKKEQDAVLKEAIQHRLTEEEVEHRMVDISRSRASGIRPIVEREIIVEGQWIIDELQNPIFSILGFNPEAFSELNHLQKETMIRLLINVRSKIEQMLVELGEDIIEIEVDMVE